MSAAATAIISFVSCAKNPTSPSQASHSLLIVRLELVAPTDMALGDFVQLTAYAVRSNGSRDDVTPQAQFQSSNSVLTVTGAGLATAGQPGQGSVTIRFEGFTATATIVVKGPFNLVGTVSVGMVGLDEVTVSVLSGVGAGFTTRTDPLGYYQLSGVSGPVQIRANKEGYLDQTQEANVTKDGTGLDFTLSVAGTVANYAGVYKLTITASSCSAGFPEEAKRRVYTAQVEQTGAALRVSLSDADFLPGSNAFAGAVMAPGEMRFAIQPLSIWDYGGADLQERLSDGTILLTFGTISATSTPQRISGTAIAQGELGGILHLPPRGSSWSMADYTGWCDIDRFDMVPITSPAGPSKIESSRTWQRPRRPS
jgi:hypothetical protein